MTLIDWENLLNEFTNKRYEFNIDKHEKVSLIESADFGSSRVLISGLTIEQMKLWINKRVKVIIKDSIQP